MKLFLVTGSLLVLQLAGSHAATLANGNFETAPFPTGWTTAGTVSSTASIVSGGGASALIGTNGTLRQDFAATTVDGFGPTSSSSQFQVGFALSASSLSTSGSGSTNRIRLRGDNYGGDLITLRLNSDGLQYFNSSNAWVTAVGTTGTFSTNTTYYFRVTGQYNGPAGGTNGLATGNYTLGYSTDGVNFTNSALISSWHGNTPISTQALESVGFEAGGTGTITVDNVTVVPEPSSVLLGSLGALALLRRRRK